jgi:hypothetical protein
MRIWLGIWLLLSVSASAQVERGICWKVGGNGLQEHCYVYGTMHTSDERVFRMHKTSKKALRKSQYVYIELDPADVANPYAVMESLKMPDSLRLDSMLGMDYYNKLETWFTTHLGVALYPFIHMPPLLILMMMDTDIQPEGFANSGPSLDTWIYQTAKSKGKTVGGIEALSEQTRIFSVIPYRDQCTWIQLFLDNSKEQTNDSVFSLEKITTFYLAGQLDSLLAYYNHMNTWMPHYQDMNSYLIYERNQHMADRAATHFREHGYTFVAVGALHLPGPLGVLELLRRKGYTVEKL